MLRIRLDICIFRRRVDVQQNLRKQVLKFSFRKVQRMGLRQLLTQSSAVQKRRMVIVVLLFGCTFSFWISTNIWIGVQQFINIVIIISISRVMRRRFRFFSRESDSRRTLRSRRIMRLQQIEMMSTGMMKEKRKMQMVNTGFQQFCGVGIFIRYLIFAGREVGLGQVGGEYGVGEGLFY